MSAITMNYYVFLISPFNYLLRRCTINKVDDAHYFIRCPVSIHCLKFTQAAFSIAPSVKVNKWLRMKYKDTLKAK